ncbi:MAG: adenine deaminase C-terminal domain-containing protein, partial [Chloroflexota bacterium]
MQRDVAVSDGEVMSQVPLPIAGLMSDQPLEIIAAQVEDILQVSHQLVANSTTRSWRSRSSRCPSFRV